MSSDRLTAMLAVRVMGWSLGPNRFQMGNRKWKPRWKFQPEQNLKDAFQLLEKASPERCEMAFKRDGEFWLRVQIAGCVGEARHLSKPLAITLAVARALGLEVGDCK